MAQSRASRSQSNSPNIETSIFTQPEAATSSSTITSSLMMNNRILADYHLTKESNHDMDLIIQLAKESKTENRKDIELSISANATEMEKLEKQSKNLKEKIEKLTLKENELSEIKRSLKTLVVEKAIIQQDLSLCQQWEKEILELQDVIKINEKYDVLKKLIYKIKNNIKILKEYSENDIYLVEILAYMKKLRMEACDISRKQCILLKKSNDLLDLKNKLLEKEIAQKVKFGNFYPDSYPKNKFKLENITQLMKNAALPCNEENLKRLFDCGENLYYVFSILFNLGITALTPENFRLVTTYSKHAYNINKLLVVVIKSVYLENLSTLFFDIVRFSPLVENIIEQIPDGIYRHPFEQDQGGLDRLERMEQKKIEQSKFIQILKDLEEKIRNQSRSKIGFLSCLPRNNELFTNIIESKEPTSWTPKKLTEWFDDELNDIIFSFAFSFFHKPISIDKSKFEEKITLQQKQEEYAGGKKFHNHGNRALFLAMDSSPPNFDRINALITAYEDSTSLAAYRKSDNKSFFMLAVEKLAQNPKDPNYFKIVTYLMTRISHCSAGFDGIPRDIEKALNIIKNLQLPEEIKKLSIEIREHVKREISSMPKDIRKEMEEEGSIPELKSSGCRIS